VVNPDDLVDWYRTPLGMTAFLAKVRSVVSEEEYELLLRWVSRRGPRLTEGEREQAEVLAERVKAVLLRRDEVEAGGAER
jgi:hypothetical protein